MRLRRVRRRHRLIAALAAVSLLSQAEDGGAQDGTPVPSPEASGSPLLPGFVASVEVVAVTPIHGIGLSREKVPANVQVLTSDHLPGPGTELPEALAGRAASVHLAEVQGGAFQPDLLFRGFGGSPLLGASEGLAVYQDGVRINDPFGDTIHWDTLPASAIASINLSPGSNPLFGLNALGGALSVRTKDGFRFPGVRASISTGSFDRHRVEASAGGHEGSLGYFLAGSLLDEAGWRDHSPSTLRRLFGALNWRRAASFVSVTGTAASNDLTGNGAAPRALLEQRRSAVFTWPDRTDNDVVLLSVAVQHRASSSTVLDAVAYYRAAGTGTFNGDAADDDDDDLDGEENGDGTSYAGAGAPFDAVNHRSRTRGRSFGMTGQITLTRPLLGRDNHLMAGAGLDVGSSRFGMTAEHAWLTPARGTSGSGLDIPAAAVGIHGRAATGSLFVLNAWTIAPALTLTASARGNWTAVRLRDQLGTALDGDHAFRRLNPSAGLTWQVRPSLGVYGSYAESSRVPTPVELTCADPQDPCRLPNAFVSDPPLEQVVARTWEAGARGAAGPVGWSAAAFTTASSDDIIFVSSGTLRGEGHFENVERTRRTGIEAALDFTLDRFSLFAAYTGQRAVFGSDLRAASRFHPMADAGGIPVNPGDRLPGVPAHVAKLGVSAQATARVTVSATLYAQSGPYLRGDEANLLEPVPGFATVGLRVRHRFTPRLALVADVQNLLDARYSTFGVLGEAAWLGAAFEDDPRFLSPGAPRAAWAGVEIRFDRAD